MGRGRHHGQCRSRRSITASSRKLNVRGRQLRGPYVHVAGGGSISGARGLRSRVLVSSSTCDLRSAAFTARPAARSGFVVVLANLKKGRRLTHEVLFSNHYPNPLVYQPQHTRCRSQGFVPSESGKVNRFQIRTPKYRQCRPWPVPAWFALEPAHRFRFERVRPFAVETLKGEG